MRGDADDELARVCWDLGMEGCSDEEYNECKVFHDVLGIFWFVYLV